MFKYTFQKTIAFILLLFALILGLGVLIAFENYLVFFIIIIPTTIVVKLWVNKIKAREREERIYKDELIRQRARNESVDKQIFTK